METSSDYGLTVTIDDETNVITFDWDPETHPEWDFLQDLTSEELCEMLLEYASEIINEKTKTSEVSTGGQSCGTPESDGDSGVES